MKSTHLTVLWLFFLPLTVLAQFPKEKDYNLRQVSPVLIGPGEYVYTVFEYSTLKVYDVEHNEIASIPIDYNIQGDGDYVYYSHLSRHLFDNDKALEVLISPYENFDTNPTVITVILNEDGSELAKFGDERIGIHQTQDKAKLVMYDGINSTVYALPGNTPEYDQQLWLAQQHSGKTDTIVVVESHTDTLIELSEVHHYTHDTVYLTGENTTINNYMVEHEWEDTKLRFKNPDGSWNAYVDLQGEQGPQGEKGDMPAHEWHETSLRFENPDGTWGEFVNLKGKDADSDTSDAITGIDNARVYYNLTNPKPNPAFISTSIGYYSPIQNSTLVIYGMNGKKVKSIKLPSTDGNISLNVTNLSTGTYYYRLENKKGSSGAKKLIVSH